MARHEWKIDNHTGDAILIVDSIERARIPSPNQKMMDQGKPGGSISSYEDLKLELERLAGCSRDEA